MRRYLSLIVLVCAVLGVAPCCRRSHAAGGRICAQRELQGSATPPVASAPSDEGKLQQNQTKITTYTLPGDLYKKAKDLSRIRFRSRMIDFFYGLFVFWLILRWKLAPKYRDWAAQFSAHSFFQALIFTLLLSVTVAVLESPTAIFDHAVSRAYGLSVEGWGALAWDWAKGIFLLIVIGSILVWILYEVIRRSPGRWWFYFWLVSIPILLFLSFVEPFVLEPMFFTFAPLEQKDAALVTQIESDRRAGSDGYSAQPNFLDEGERQDAHHERIRKWAGPIEAHRRMGYNDRQ